MPFNKIIGSRYPNKHIGCAIHGLVVGWLRREETPGCHHYDDRPKMLWNTQWRFATPCPYSGDRWRSFSLSVGPDVQSALALSNGSSQRQTHGSKPERLGHRLLFLRGFNDGKGWRGLGTKSLNSRLHLFTFVSDIVVGVGDLLKFYTDDGTITNTVTLNSRNITALAYDEVHDIMLYVDKQSSNDSICGYSLSSTEHKCFIERNGRNIQGIAFDPPTQTLFFTDANDNSINWISLRPQTVNNVHGNLLIKMNDRTPSDIAVDSCRGYVINNSFKSKFVPLPVCSVNKFLAQRRNSKLSRYLLQNLKEYPWSF